MSQINQMILIGSSGRNNGKTTLATRIITKYKKELPIVALKIITITDVSSNCHRGVTGCGICSSLKKEYEIVEELSPFSDKDTSQLLRAGATASYMLKTKQASLEKAWRSFYRTVPSNCLLIVESNSLRNITIPGLFLFCNNVTTHMKPSAASVYKHADVVVSNGEEFDIERLVIHHDPPSIELKRETSNVF